MQQSTHHIEEYASRAQKYYQPHKVSARATTSGGWVVVMPVSQPIIWPGASDDVDYYFHSITANLTSDTLIREKFNSEDVNQPIEWPTTSDND